MDPFKFPANAPYVPDYKTEVCPRTLDLLSRTVFVPVDPDWTEEQIDALALRMLDGAAR